MNLLRAAAAAFAVAALGACASHGLQQNALTDDEEYARFVIVTVRNDRTPPPPRAGSSVRTYGGGSSYAVAPLARSTVRAIAAAHDLREVDAWPIDMLGVHCVVFEIAADAALAATIERLRRDEGVESVQPMQSFTALSAAGAPASGAGRYRELQRNLDVMHVRAAHRWSRGAGVRIGVIDTRVDVAHPDLAGRVVRTQDLVGDDRSTSAADRHGTAVAGVIAATGRGEQGVIGVAPEAQLHALRACWPRADDPMRAACSSFTLAKALVAAIEAHLHIVNLSLAGPADALLTRIVETGLKRGVVFVGATPASGALQSFPTNIAGVIAVNASGGASIADATAGALLFAPGTDVLTLTPGGRYDFMSGSSLAAASISGGAALLLARDRTLGAGEIRTLLARSMSAQPAKTVSVDLCSALIALIAGASCDG